MTMPRFEPFAATPASRITAAVSAFMVRLREDYLHHRALKNDRAAFMRMAALDDDMLDDIGVTREDVAWAASLPLEVNAAQAVRQRARLRLNRTGKRAPTQEPNVVSKTDGASAFGHLPSVVAARWLSFGQVSGSK